MKFYIKISNKNSSKISDWVFENFKNYNKPYVADTNLKISHGSKFTHIRFLISERIEGTYEDTFKNYSQIDKDMTDALLDFNHRFREISKTFYWEYTRTKPLVSEDISEKQSPLPYILHLYR